MYWGDAILGRIEMAYVDGTGRRTLFNESTSLYVVFQFHDGNIYFSDWTIEYAFIFSCRKATMPCRN